MNNTTEKHLIQSISRAAAILRCFNEKEEISLTEISSLTGLHKSTASGLVNTLKAEHFLEKDESSGKYRLGLDIFRLAANSKIEIDRLCEPYLDMLLKLTGETVNLAVRDGVNIAYVAKKESPHSMRISTRVGARLPIYCTAIGKAILAEMDEAAVAELIVAIEMKPFTKNTVSSPEKLMEELMRVKKDGVAFDLEEFEYGLICMAAPIYYRRGSPVGAVSVSGPSMRMDEETRKTTAMHLREISAEICRELCRVAPA